MMKKLITIMSMCFIVFAVSGCARSLSYNTPVTVMEKGELTTKQAKGYGTAKTITKQAKYTMATAICTNESNNFNKGIVISEVEVPQGDNAAPIKFKSRIPRYGNFNINSCIEEALRWSGERLAMGVLKFAGSLVKWGAAVAVANKVLDNQGDEYNTQGGSVYNAGENSSINVGSEGSSSELATECPIGQVAGDSGICRDSGEIDLGGESGSGTGSSGSSNESGGSGLGTATPLNP